MGDYDDEYRKDAMTTAEIEVTPEMIEAGGELVRDLLSSDDPEWDSAEEYAAEIYRVMYARRPPPPVLTQWPQDNAPLTNVL